MVCEKDGVFLLTCNYLFLLNADVNWLPGSASPREGGGGTLGISGWGCAAAGTLEPLTYTRGSSAEFCYPILE